MTQDFVNLCFYFINTALLDFFDVFRRHRLTENLQKWGGFGLRLNLRAYRMMSGSSTCAGPGC